MLHEHLVVIHLVDVIAREDEHVFRFIHVDEIYVVIDRISGSFVPFSALFACIRRKDVYAAVRHGQVPGLACPNVLVEHERLVLDEDADRVDT